LSENLLRPAKKAQAITYTPDFSYIYQGVLVVEDVKGATKKGEPIIYPEAKLRHRLFQLLYPEIVFCIVTKPKEFEWAFGLEEL